MAIVYLNIIGVIVKISVVKKDKIVKSESIEYCCGNMQGAMEAENIRKPMYSAQEPAVLLGNRVVSFCPFCAEKVDVIIRDREIDHIKS
jgi:hypothetical protein